MSPDMPVFDGIRDDWPDKVTAWDLANRPVPARGHQLAAVLEPEIAIVTNGETCHFRQLIREWPDRDAAEEIAEVMHQRDLEQAAQPPVIEVTVTTPPEGLPRAHVAELVKKTVERFTGPQPVLSGTDPFPEIRPGGRR